MFTLIGELHAIARLTRPGNALKYTLEGSVSVVVEYDAEEAIVRIVDTGVGVSGKLILASTDISAKDLEIFGEPEPSSRDGMGIALSFTKVSICQCRSDNQKLVQLHGGNMTIDTRNSEEAPNEPRRFSGLKLH